MRWEYKCLPLPVLEKAKDNDPEVHARKALSELLNEMGRDGWEFDRQENFTLEQKTGLMGRGRPKSVALSSLIFKRSLSHADVPHQAPVARPPVQSTYTASVADSSPNDAPRGSLRLSAVDPNSDDDVGRRGPLGGFGRKRV